MPTQRLGNICALQRHVEYSDDDYNHINITYNHSMKLWLPEFSLKRHATVHLAAELAEAELGDSPLRRFCSLPRPSSREPHGADMGCSNEHDQQFKGVAGKQSAWKQSTKGWLHNQQKNQRYASVSILRRTIYNYSLSLSNSGILTRALTTSSHLNSYRRSQPHPFVATLKAAGSMTP